MEPQPARIPAAGASAAPRPVDRLPPHNVEAEQAILGAVMLDRDALGLATEKLAPGDFYRREHQLIFAAMRHLYERDQAIDTVTVAAALEQEAALEDAGGRAYLSDLLSMVATAANVGYHAAIVKEKAVLRGLIHAATDIAGEAYEAGDEAALILDRAQARIYSIAETTRKGGFEAVRSVVPAAFRTIEEAYRNKSDVTGLRTGYIEFDRYTAGLQKSDLIVLAARPSMGKTALALNVAYNVAVREGVGVAIFSLEMAKEQLVMRMLCASGGFDNHAIRRGQIRPEDWPRLTAACERLAAAPIFIDDTSAISILEMKAKARRLKKQHDIGLIIIDYLQLMSSASRVENRQQEISEISRNLKGLAKDLEVPVMALSQLSRAVESRGDNRPKLSDLRECVSGDTLVCLADGQRLPIRDLVGQTPQVVACDPRGRLMTAASDLVWCVGRRPVSALRLASGRTIRATGRHRLLGAKGWVRLEQLQPGDQLSAIDGDAGARATDDLFWDRVVAIEPAGEEDVYDLTVPGPACWLADGIVSHNSGAIEQDSDVVLFIFRPEVYSPDDEKVRNLATVIIGKQRNGPIGEFDLHFHKAFTRFDNLERRGE